ncbi:MAG TPA: class I SAM-dependent methyltransferase [Dongiaceae bacterium]|nr:class I SAM-dependent methyltransferase [Dongiaceae bacterium]
MSCDLVYASEPPELSYLSAAYADAAYDSGEEARCAAQSYARALAPHIEQLPGRNAAVDVGAGCGPLLPWLKQCKFGPVIGIEPSKAAIQAAPEDVRGLLREGVFSKDILDGVSPSLICSFMTLEHLPNPGQFVKTAYELLEPGGMIAIVVHNWRGLLNRLLGRRSPIIDIEHLQLFNPNSVATLLRLSGFKMIRVQCISNSYPLRYWLRLTPLPSKLKAVLGHGLEKLALADKHIKLNVGNILAIGIKDVSRHA